MPRQPRKLGNSKVYHVIFKGIDDQDIFYDDKDRRYFIKQLKEIKKDNDFNLYAYCLMGNHVHLVLRAEDANFSNVIKRLIIRYAYYFNQKYMRKGPLIQDRFKSKNVEDLRYFLEVCRYVHRNPEKAGIAKTSEYEWSSYHEYIGEEKLIEKSALLYYFNNDLKNFIKYTNKADNIDDMLKFAEYEMYNKLSDEEVTEIIMKQFELSSKEEVATFFKLKSLNQRKECVSKLKMISGTNIAQLARITRINRYLFK